MTAAATSTRTGNLEGTIDRAPARGASSLLSPRAARALLLLCLAAATTAGFVFTRGDANATAVAAAGEELTRLLRGMALLKALLAFGAAAAVFWRLGAPVSRARFVVYALACGAMAAGPGLIWGLSYVGAGALLLHGGLLATVVVVWRDPAAAARLSAILAARRAALRAR